MMIDKNKYRILLLAVIAVTAIDGAYLGCFKENLRSRLYNRNPGAIPSNMMEPGICMTRCGQFGHDFAALGAGKFCWCGNTAPGVLTQNNSKCTLPCETGVSTCGSVYYVDVYEALPPIKLAVTVSKYVWETGQTVTFNVAVTTTAPSYKLSFDYDDGSGQTAYVASGTGLLTHTFYKSGKYNVKVRATSMDEQLPPVESAAAVKIESAVTAVTLTCPTFMPTYQNDSCTAEIERGTNVNFQYSVAATTPTTFHAADVNEYWMGNGVQQTSTSVSTTTGGLSLIQQSQARYGGTLFGVEFSAENTGTVNFYVYRPSLVGNDYCYQINNMVAPGSCPPACGGMYCTQVSTCCAGPPARTTGMLPAYVLVHTITVTVSATGIQYVPDYSGVLIQPGDILGLDAGNIVSISDVPAADGDYFCTGLTGPATVTTGCAATTEMYQARAIYGQPSKASIPLYFTSLGAMTVSATVSNVETSIVGSATDATSITVLEGVDKCEILISPEYIDANVLFTIPLAPFTGQPAIVDYSFGDGGQVSVATPSVGTHTYAAGMYYLEVNISNALSFKACAMMIYPEEPIVGLSLGVGNVLELGVASNIELKMTSGSNYTCTLLKTYSTGQAPESLALTSDQYPPGSNISLEFLVPDLNMQLSIECQNDVSAASYSTTTKVVERITGCIIDPSGAWPWTDYIVTGTWATGTDVKVELQYDGIDEPIEVDQAAKLAVAAEKPGNAGLACHPVNLTLNNDLNTCTYLNNFCIEQPLDGIVITVDLLEEIPGAENNKKAIKISSSIEVDVSIISGTSANIVIEYCGAIIKNASVPQWADWNGNEPALPIVLPATDFSTPQECEFKVTVGNSVNSEVVTYDLMTIEDNFDGIVFNMVGGPAFAFTPPALVDFEFPPPTPLPNFLNMNVSWGDGLWDYIDPLDLSQTLQHEYNLAGDFVLDWTVSNLGGSKSGSISLEIVTPVYQPLLTPATTAGSPGTPIVLMATFYRAPDAGLCDLTFDCANGVDLLVTGPRTANSPYGVDNYTCVYGTTGTFYPSVTVTSSLEPAGVVATSTLVIMYPVIESDFDILSNTPIDYEVNQTCNSYIDIVHNILATMPDNAMLLVDYGDGTVDGPTAYAASPANLQHTYATDGSYVSTISVYNNASGFTTQIESGCYRQIVGSTVSILRAPLYGTADLVGFGPSNNIFRTDEDLALYLTCDGTFGYWEISAVSTPPGNTFLCNSTDYSRVPFSVTEPGFYTVSHQCINLLYPGPVDATTTITMMKPSLGIIVSDAGVTPIDTVKTFSVTMDSFGTDQCVAVQSDEETVVHLYGNFATCSSKTSVLGNTNLQYSATPVVSVAFTVQFTFSESRDHTLKLFAWNTVSETEAAFDFPISDVDCNRPTVSIVFGTTNFQDPAMQTYRRDREIELIGTMGLSCPKTPNNTKLWQLFEWDEVANKMIGEEDLSNQNTRRNAKLFLEPYKLQRGLYKAVFTVEMLATTTTSSAKFVSHAYSFIRVKESPLVVQLFSGGSSWKTYGPAEIVPLNAAEHSYDPDMDPSSGEPDIFTKFDISCTDLTAGEVRQPLSVTRSPPNPNLPLTPGGCGTGGPGWFQPYTGSYDLDTQYLIPTHKYELHVVGYKGDRSSSFTAYLEVMPAQPPGINIRFIQSKITTPEMQNQKINPSAQLGITVDFDDGQTSSTRYGVMWEMFVQDHNYYNKIPEGWRPVQDFYKYCNGIQSQQLAVRTLMWEHYPNDANFLLQLSVNDSTTGVTGKSQLRLQKNLPPTGGSCSINPAAGSSLKTPRTIECNGFVDVDGDGINSYTVYCNGSQTRVKVCSGPYPRWTNWLLPGGAPTTNQLYCWVEVQDSLGAIGIATIAPVESSMSSGQDRLDELNDIASQLDEIKAKDSLDQCSGYLAALGPTLASLSNDVENTDYAGIGTYESQRPSGFDTNQVRVSAFNQSSPDPARLQEYEEMRDQCGGMVNKLVTAMDAATMKSVSDTKVTYETLAMASQSQAYLSKDTQATIVHLLNKGLENLLTNKEDLSVEDAIIASSCLRETCQNLIEGTVANADYPSLTDIAVQEKPVQTFPTNLDSKVPDAKISEDMTDEEATRAGMMVLNTYDQTEFSETLKSKCDRLKTTSTQLMNQIRAMSNMPITMSTSRTETTIITTTAGNLQGFDYGSQAGSMRMPESILAAQDTDAPVTLVCEGLTSPEVKLSDTPESIGDRYSRSISASFQSAYNGAELKIANLQEMIEIDLGRDPNRPPDSESLTYTNPVVPRPTDWGFLHSVPVTKENAAILIALSGVTDANLTTQFLVLVNFETPPDLTPEGDKVLHSCLIPKNPLQRNKTCDENESSPWACLVPAEIIGKKTGQWKIRVIQLDPSEINLYPYRQTLPKAPRESWLGRNFTNNYIAKMVEIVCAYSETGSSVMKTEGCYPQESCSGDVVKCKCNHLTSFAGGWVVAPNVIDWDFIFSNMDFFKNPTLYITEIVILIAYILAMIWARRTDRKDLTMLGLAPLLDNDPRDKYYYEIMVNTGMRRNAGTESNVHFILSGEEDETDVRTFTDKKRKIFQRGQTDGFLMAVESNLGALSYLRIWHDNSGKGKTASWYLNHVLVRDVQTDKKYYFITNKWFAVEEEDGQVDRVIPVAGKEQMTEFAYMFSERATKNLSDGHLWFSVVARPPNSRFTRCQRVSCCLCLLFMSMLANAMFYGMEDSDNTAYSFGPFALTPEQIFIGIAANILIFPINFLIITLFRKSRPRKLRPSRVEEALKSMPERTTSMTDVNMRVKSSMSNERPGSSFLIDAKRPESSMSVMTQVNLNEKKKKKKCTLPWWFVIVGWILLWITVLVSVAFVTFYGIMFQDIKCKKWITSMLVSFFTSVFLTQPIKVFLFAIIFSLIIKNPGGDEDEAEEDEEPTKKLENDEELLHREEDGYGLIAPQKPMYKPKPPDPKSLETARVQRLKEIQMWSVIREILFYGFFLWILLVISYKSISNNSYHYKYNMEKVFIVTTNSSKSFKQVKNVESFWNWAQDEMPRGLRAGPYYNEFPAFNMRGYINDKVSRILGYAVLRQLRVKKDSCKIAPQVEDSIDECNGEYSYGSEQTDNFGPGWTGPYNSSREEYLYRDSNELNGYPFWGQMSMYSGGGYIVKLNQDFDDMVTQLHQLEREKWIDEYTRAVFLEFTVYNPAINMFAISTLLAEFRPSGGVFPTYRFEPATLLPYMSTVLLFQIICEIIYFLFTCYFVVKELRSLYKERMKYFYQFWNIMDLCICIMSVSAIVIYFYRLVCINEITEFFRKTQGYEYMKFQYVGYWSEMFSYIIGFLVYFACLKFLKLLRFNKRVSLLADTLKNSAKDLIHFSIIFNIVFLAFIQVFFLLYVARIHTFKTFVSSCEAGIVMMMGKFDIYEMLEVNQWLTQIFLFLFVVTITFIVVNMFLSILNDTFGAVRNNMAQQSNDYEIVEFMMSRFKLWTGIGRGAAPVLSPADMEKERRKRNDTVEGKIDYFPEQIDRFLASISNMYMEKSKFDDFLHKGAYGKMALKAQQHGGGPTTMHPAPKPGSTRLSDGARGMTDVHTH